MEATTNGEWIGESVLARIFFVRARRVMLDSDLSALYGVPTKALLQSCKRNIARFPEDFMFQLSSEEWERLRSQFVTSKPGRGGRRYVPFAFTEQGVAMLSSVLNSPQAISVNVEIMRTFVRLRELMASSEELSQRIEALERELRLLALKQDACESQSQHQIDQIFNALRALMTPGPERKRRPIGFVTPED